MVRLLTDEEIERQLLDLPHWTRQGRELVREVEAPDFRTGIAVVAAVADLAEEVDHHPDIDVRWRTLRLAVWTHVAGGITQLDIELAHRIDEVVADVLAPRGGGRIEEEGAW
ncbi:MAG: 4a-hydroxytetrahydrobiopterin dehydratase [Motilibacteraceae bacterium]